MKSIKEEDQVMRGIAKKIMMRFDKYWDVVLAFDTILDLRTKLETL